MAQYREMTDLRNVIELVRENKFRQIQKYKRSK